MRSRIKELEKENRELDRWTVDQKRTLQHFTSRDEAMAELLREVERLRKIDRSCPVHEDLRGLCADLERENGRLTELLTTRNSQIDQLGEALRKAEDGLEKQMCECEYMSDPEVAPVLVKVCARCEENNDI